MSRRKERPLTGRRHVSGNCSKDLTEGEWEKLNFPFSQSREISIFCTLYTVAGNLIGCEYTEMENMKFTLTWKSIRLVLMRNSQWSRTRNEIRGSEWKTFAIYGGVETFKFWIFIYTWIKRRYHLHIPPLWLFTLENHLIWLYLIQPTSLWKYIYISVVYAFYRDLILNRSGYEIFINVKQIARDTNPSISIKRDSARYNEGNILFLFLWEWHIPRAGRSHRRRARVIPDGA